jgi:hypothetical protein
MLFKLIFASHHHPQPSYAPQQSYGGYRDAEIETGAPAPYAAPDSAPAQYVYVISF